LTEYKLSHCNLPSLIKFTNLLYLLTYLLFSAQSVASEHSVIDSGCGDDFSPGIHHVPTRLL